jgi:hypothetical protein
MHLFGKASQATADRTVRSKALYNSGVIMMAMQQPERAAALFKQALRLDEGDRDAKFNLEQLYRFVQTGVDGGSEASRDQLPQLPKQAPPDATEGELGSGKGRQRCFLLPNRWLGFALLLSLHAGCAETNGCRRDQDHQPASNLLATPIAPHHLPPFGTL